MSTAPSLDLYVAASTAIPVLWIGIGLSTGAIGAVIRALRTTVAGHVGLRLGNADRHHVELSLSVAPLAIRVNGIEIGTSTVGLFFGMVVISGLYGEIVALYALFESKSALWTRWSVVMGGGVLSLLTAVVLAVSMATIAAAREESTQE